MSIQSEITRITNKRDESFTAIGEKGVTVPADSTIDDMPGLISSIQLYKYVKQMSGYHYDDTLGGYIIDPDSTEVVTGEITIASDISSPSSSESKTIPGITLNFQPDFFFLSMTKSTWDDLASSATTGHVYWMGIIKANIFPVIRITSSSTSGTSSSTIRAFCCTTGYNSTDNTTSYGASSVNPVDNTRIAYWGFNDNGTIKYGRTNSSTQTAFYAGTYRYFAFKVESSS